MFVSSCSFLQISPVQPGEEALGCSDQVHHGGEEVVGQLASGSAVVVAAAPPACDEVLQVLGRRVELVRQGLQVLRLQPVILEKSKKSLFNTVICSGKSFKGQAKTGKNI